LQKERQCDHEFEKIPSKLQKERRFNNQKDEKKRLRQLVLGRGYKKEKWQRYRIKRAVKKLSL
jgi:hypothetical protein